MKRLFQTDWRKDRDKPDKRPRNDAQEEAPNVPTDVFPPAPSTSLHGSNTMASRGAYELTTSSSSPIGMSVLHDPSEGNAAVECLDSIVFIHGLKGHREKTWTSDKASEPWPKALLPSEIPDARVLAYGYDADVAKATEMVSVSRIRDHAATFLKRLTNFRDRTDSSARPIIFVCHSLGGLVCQAALARAHTREHLKEVLEATRGILFLGTPHHGSALAVWAERLGKSVGVLKQTNTEILGVLRPESEVLAEIQDNFHNITQPQTKAGVGTIQITCFYEELPLPGIGLVVPQHSAIFPGKDAIGIHGTHHTMVKFSSLEDSGFIDICDELRTWIKKFDRKVPVPQRQSTPPPAVEEQNEKRSTTPQEKTASKFLVPYAKNKSFVERSNVFERLKSEFCHGPEDDIEDARSRVCLYGLGGIGKTQIAIAYTYWLRKAHPEISVFWVHASDSDRFRQAYSEIAEECNIAGRSDRNVDVLTLVKSWFERQKTGPWFLVLDNADNTELFFNDHTQPNNTSSSDVEPNKGNSNMARFIPQYGNGSILVTTRNKEAGSRLVPGQPLVEIGPMSDGESLQMIREIAGGSSLSMDAATVLSNRLENLPLAIAQAAAFMHENCMSLHQYLVILSKGDGVEVQLLGGNFEAVGRDADVPHAGMATWVVSFEHIKKRNPLAADILSMMAFFDRQAIQRQFMTIYMYLKVRRKKEQFDNESDDNGSSPGQDEARHYKASFDFNAKFLTSKDFEDDSREDICDSIEDHINEYFGDPDQSLETLERDGAYSILLEQALGILKAFSFIKENKDGTLCIHRLVQLATADWLKRKGTARRFFERALATLNKFFMASVKTFSFSYKTISHYQALLAANARNPSLGNASVSMIRHSMAMFYCFVDQLTLALDYVEKALETKGYDQQKVYYFEARRLKATILQCLNRNQEAKQILIELVTILPQNSETKLLTIKNLVSLFLKLGDYGEARDLLVGGDAPPLMQKACLIVYLGTAFRKLGDIEAEEEADFWAFKIVEEALASGKAAKLMSVFEMACTFFSQRKWKEAERICRQLLLSNMLDKPEASSIQVNVLSTLAAALYRQGYHLEAIDTQRQVVRLCNNSEESQPRSNEEANALRNLAILQLESELFEDAEESIAHALQLFQGIHGDTGKFVLSCVYHLGFIKYKLGKWEESKNILENGYQRSVDEMGSLDPLSHRFKRVMECLAKHTLDSEMVE
ncbi:hypothetical protein CPAR01_14959 [Colletotrichum paranaense]|uniref:DUF676 domain-containing protein n=1 Tax=Colletotrichum paranaense TaxID=1914294 RepID=A0ABQ9S0H2_9PEZI|nr:uncharacterized protein CPAR01_14959 [Colletotrichum paranaense]KAK1521436.1 hypothetical protein CPAR01_14959 [Colletotrichum paranaense]